MSRANAYTSGVSLQKKVLAKVKANKNPKPLRTENDLDRRERLLEKAKEKKESKIIWVF